MPTKCSKPKPRNPVCAVMLETSKPAGAFRRRDKIIPRKSKHKSKIVQ